MEEQKIVVFTLTVEVGGESASIEVLGSERISGARAADVAYLMAQRFERDGFEVGVKASPSLACGIS